MQVNPKILFLLPGLDVGGAERQTLDLREYLRVKGHQSDLIVYGTRCSERMLRSPGAEGAIRLNIHGMSDPKGWLHSYTALRRGDYSIIFAVNQTPAIVAIVLRAIKATNAKVVCIFHTTLLRSKEARQLPLFRAIARSFDAMVFVSANQASYWSANGLSSRTNVTIVNGVDADSFPAVATANGPAKEALGIPADEFVIGQVAAFRPEKNHIQVVEALANLRASGISAKILFVGDGPTRPAAEALAAKRGVAEHVLFAGEQGDVRPYIAAFDVGVLPSTAVETFSLAALELLSCGVPIVISEIGGASEIVENGVNGFLFPPGDLNQFEDRLRRLVDPEIRDRLRAQARPSVRRYSATRMVNAYERLIEELLNDDQ